MISPGVFAARLILSHQVEDEWQKEWKRKTAEEMRNNAPVDTGALRASIRTTVDGVLVDVDYGVYVEYGTSDMPPQPFAVPAVNRVSKPATKDAGELVIRRLT